MESLHQLQTLGELLDLGFRVGLRNFLAQTANLVLEVDLDQQLADSLGTHAGIEVVTELFEGFEVPLVVQQLTFSRVVMPGSITT